MLWGRLPWCSPDTVLCWGLEGTGLHQGFPCDPDKRGAAVGITQQRAGVWEALALAMQIARSSAALQRLGALQNNTTRALMSAVNFYGAEGTVSGTTNEFVFQLHCIRGFQGRSRVIHPVHDHGALSPGMRAEERRRWGQGVRKNFVYQCTESGPNQFFLQ